MMRPSPLPLQSLRKKGPLGRALPAVFFLLMKTTGMVPGASLPEGGSTSDFPSPNRFPQWFPESGQIPGWTRVQEPAFFVGEEIFPYMDGAGEIPCSYGFRQLGAAGYLQGEKQLEVVLFEMEDCAAAFGYFSVRGHGGEEKPGPQGLSVRLLPGYALTAWKDRFTLVVQAVQGPIGEDVFRQFAGAVLRNIRGRGRAPKLLHFLPRKDRIAPSVKYVRGKPAFDAEVMFIPEDLFGLRNRSVEIVSAEYQFQEAKGAPERASYRLVLLRYPNRSEAAQAFRSFSLFRWRARANGRSLSPGQQWIFPGPSGGVEGAFSQGNFLGLLRGALPREKASKILRYFQHWVDRLSSRWQLQQREHGENCKAKTRRSSGSCIGRKSWDCPSE